MCKEHTIPKYPSIINHKKPFYVNVNGEKDEISKSAKNKATKRSSDRSLKLTFIILKMTLSDRIGFWKCHGEMFF